MLLILDFSCAHVPKNSTLFECSKLKIIVATRNPSFAEIGCFGGNIHSGITFVIDFEKSHFHEHESLDYVTKASTLTISILLTCRECCMKILARFSLMKQKFT